MTWKEKMDEWGGAAVSFLSEDAEVITFCVIADPVLIVGKYQGRETARVGCPVVTADGYSLLVIGKRAARKLAKYEDQFEKCAFEMIRHGAGEDTKTKYEVRVCADNDLVHELLGLKKKGVEQEDIDESIQEATKIANG